MTTKTDGVFRLTLFGGFTLKDPQGQIITLGLRKAEGLLAYVAAAPDQAASREVLASLLWGDFSQTKARQNLRQTLLDLSRAFAAYDPAPVKIGNQMIALEPGLFDIDTERFTDLVARNSLESLREAVALQRGDFLAGFTVRASDFQNWASDLREEFHERGLRATTALLSLQEEKGQLEQAIATAKRALQLDPLREDFHRHLIRLYSKNGMRSAAVSQFRACARLLKEELDIDPDQETLQLFRELVGEGDRDVLLGEALPQGDAAALSESRSAIPASPPRRPEELPRHRRGSDVAWSGPSGVLVGRQKEIDTLSRVLLDMGPSAQRAVLLEGEAGSGKSHLVQSFLEGLEGANALLLRVLAGDQGPYVIWRSLVDAIRERELNADAAHMPLVEAIDNFDSALSAGDPGELLTRLEAVLLAAADRGATFVIFEDLQHADAASLELLLEILRSLAALRTAFLLTLRWGDLPTETALAGFLAEVSEERLAERLILAPLSPRHVQELTRCLAVGLPNKKLSEARRAWVWSVSEGNPQVAIECLLELAQMAPGETPKAEALPAELQARLEARMAPLSATARKLLLAAALVGREAALDLLSLACDLEDQALADAVDELQATQLLRVEDDKILFVWNRTRYAAMNQVGRRRRRVMQDSLRDAMLKLFAGRRLRVAEALAAHSRGAARPVSALRFEALAAQRSLRQGRFEAAYRDYERLRQQAEELAAEGARDLGGEAAEDVTDALIAIRLSMAQTAEYLDDATTALAALEGIEALGRLAAPAVAAPARASIMRARLSAKAGDVAAAEALAAKGTSLASDRLEAGAWLAPDALLDRLWGLQGRRAALRRWLALRKTEAGELDLRIDAVQLAVIEAILAGVDGDKTSAVAAASAAVESAEALGLPRFAALAQQTRGIAAIWAGEGQAAEEWLTAGLTSAAAAGDLFRGYLLRGFLAMAQAASGDLGAADESLQQALQQAARLGTTLAVPSFSAWRAEALLAAGNGAAAADVSRQAAHLAGHINSGWGRACIAAAIEAKGDETPQGTALSLGCWSRGWPRMATAG